MPFPSLPIVPDDKRASPEKTIVALSYNTKKKKKTFLFIFFFFRRRRKWQWFNSPDQCVVVSLNLWPIWELFVLRSRCCGFSKRHDVAGAVAQVRDPPRRGRHAGQSSRSSSMPSRPHARERAAGPRSPPAAAVARSAAASRGDPRTRPSSNLAGRSRSPGRGHRGAQRLGGVSAPRRDEQSASAVWPASGLHRSVDLLSTSAAGVDDDAELTGDGGDPGARVVGGASARSSASGGVQTTSMRSTRLAEPAEVVLARARSAGASQKASPVSRCRPPDGTANSSTASACRHRGASTRGLPPPRGCRRSPRHGPRSDHAP